VTVHPLRLALLTRTVDAGRFGTLVTQWFAREIERSDDFKLDLVDLSAVGLDELPANRSTPPRPPPRRPPPPTRLVGPFAPRRSRPDAVPGLSGPPALTNHGFGDCSTLSAGR